MRTCVVNMAGLAVFAVAAACAGVAEQGWCGALIFQLVILFLCNEAWYWCMKGGALVSTLFGVASKKAEARPAAVEGKVYVLSSFALPVLPHVLYAVLYMGEKLTSGEFIQGLACTPGLFMCSYAGVGAMWALGLLLRAYPFALERLFESRMLSPGDYIGMDEPPAAKGADEGSAVEQVADAADMLPEHRAALAAELKPDEKILRALRPEVTALNRYARSHAIWGKVLAAVAFFAFMLALDGYTSYLLKSDARYLSICAVGGALALGFGYCAWGMLRSPARWRAKLSATSYAVTDRRLFIFEGDSVRSFELTPELHMLYDSVPGELCNIFVSKPGRLSRAIGSVFGVKARGADATAVQSVDLKAPLPGCFHVPESFYLFLKKLCDQEK